MDDADLQTSLAAFFNKDRRVIAAYLFGSRAAGTASTQSDIDIAILLNRTTRRALFANIALKFTCDLMRQLQFDRIDIVILNSAGPIIRHQVYRKGKAVFCRDRKSAMRFRDLAVAEYLDFLPFRRRAEDIALKRLAGGGARG